MFGAIWFLITDRKMGNLTLVTYICTHVSCFKKPTYPVVEALPKYSKYKVGQSVRYFMCSGKNL